MNSLTLQQRSILPSWIAILFTLSGTEFSLPFCTHAAKVESAGTELFDGNTIPRIAIEIPERGMAELRPYRWDRRRPLPRPKVQAVVREGEKVYHDVSIHPKGAMGSFRPIDDRPALTLNFDKHVDGQKFHGLTKISLNNSVQDPSLIKEKLCRELFNEIGVPTPRSDFAFVTLNGRDLGLYVLLEGANSHFLEQRFEDTSGSLYDGGFLQDITAPLDITYGNKENDRSDLRALAAAARIKDGVKRFTEMSRLMDMDRFIKMLALEALMAQWDGYAQNKNNYRIYHDPTTDKLVFVPHGLDLVFGRIENSVVPKMTGLVARAVLTTPEGHARYFLVVREFHASLFQPDALLRRLDKIDAKIRAAGPVAARNQPLPARRLGNPNSPVQMLSPRDRFTEQLRQMIRLRCSFLAEELAGEPEKIPIPLPQALDFSTDILLPKAPPALAREAPLLARLDGWRKHHTASRARSAGWVFDEVERDERTCLRIAFESRSGTASWRTSVLLPAGRFVFIGRAKSPSQISGQVPQMRLRISGDSSPSFALSREWSEFAYPMTVATDEAPREVELVCEATGSGEAWFDKEWLLVAKLAAAP